MRSSIQHISHDLALVYAHVLPEIIVATKVLPASLDRTLVRCDRITESQPEALTTKDEENSRFSLVWIDRTCRFKCSPRAKHLLHPSTMHRYIRMFFCTPPCTMNTGVVGTRRPRDFFVRFGTGTGALRRQGRVGRTLPLLLLTLTLLVRRERVRDRDVRLGRKSPSSSPSGPSEGSAVSLSPDSLPKSSSDSPVSPGGLDDP